MYCDRKEHVKSSCSRKVVDNRRKNDSNSVSSTNVMLVTLNQTAQEGKTRGRDELCIFAVAVGGSLGSGGGALGEIVEPMVDSGAALATCPPWFGADVPRNREQSSWTSVLRREKCE